MSNAKRRPTVGDKVRVMRDPENRDYVTVGKVYTIKEDDREDLKHPNRLNTAPFDIGGDNNRSAWMQRDCVELVEESPEPGTIESLEAKIKELSADLEAMKAAKHPELARGQVYTGAEDSPFIVAKTVHDGRLVGVSLIDGSIYLPIKEDLHYFKYIGLAKDVLSVKVP